MTSTRLAAGALGPSSVFGTRRRQKLDSASAILAACRAVLDGGETCPSIENVLAQGSGFSRSTLNRKRYKPILTAAKTRFHARLAGEWHEGQDDRFAELERIAATGSWTLPVAVDQGEPTAGASYDDDGERDGTAAAATADQIAGPPRDVDLASLLADTDSLRASVTRLASELQRRDDQLYHAVQTAQRWSKKMRSLSEEIRRLNGEIATLQTEPWEPRVLIDEDDDLDED